MEPIEVPTFLCQDEHIVDVVFTQWHVNTDEPVGYKILPSAMFHITEAFNRVVFELPTGCYEANFGLAPGSTLHFECGCGMVGTPIPLNVCRRARSFATVGEEGR